MRGGGGVTGHEGCREGTFCGHQCPALHADIRAAHGVVANDTAAEPQRPRVWLDGEGHVVLGTPPDGGHLVRMSPAVARKVGKNLLLFAREQEACEARQAARLAAEMAAEGRLR